MLDFLVAGLPVAAVLVALVELVKRVFKIEGDAAIVAAIGLGLLLSLCNQFAQMWPVFGQWYETAIAGVILGLMACGLFDTAQAVKARIIK